MFNFALYTALEVKKLDLTTPTLRSHDYGQKRNYRDENRNHNCPVQIFV